MCAGLNTDHFVIPAKAGIQSGTYERHWIPAFAGMTEPI